MARINQPLNIIKETIRVQDVKPGDVLYTRDEYPTDVLEVTRARLVAIVTPDGKFEFPYNHLVERYRVYETN